MHDLESGQATAEYALVIVAAAVVAVALISWASNSDLLPQFFFLSLAPVQAHEVALLKSDLSHLNDLGHLNIQAATSHQVCQRSLASVVPSTACALRPLLCPPFHLQFI